MADAGDLGQDRTPAGRDQDEARSQAAVARLHDQSMAVDQFGATQHGLHARLLKQRAIDAFKPRDLVILVGNQRGPMQRRGWAAPARADRILEIIAKAAGIHQQLFGNTAANDAGPAEPVFLRKGDLGAMTRGHAGGAHAARSTTHHEQIVIVPIHAMPSPPRPSRAHVATGAAPGGPKYPASISRLPPSALPLKLDAALLQLLAGLLLDLPADLSAPTLSQRHRLARNLRLHGEQLGAGRRLVEGTNGSQLLDAELLG